MHANLGRTHHAEFLMTSLELIIQILPWFMSGITIYMNILAGSLRKDAWMWGLANQLLWLAWIFMTGTWGLLPMNICLWIIYGRNHWKWNK